MNDRHRLPVYGADGELLQPLQPWKVNSRQGNGNSFEACCQWPRTTPTTEHTNSPPLKVVTVSRVGLDADHPHQRTPKRSSGGGAEAAQAKQGVVRR